MTLTLAPDDVVRTHADAASNQRQPLLVLEPLIEYLAANGLAAPADLSAEPVGDGHSNVTFALSTEVILRRPPRGPLPPSAHDVLREARLLRALEATPVRTPRVLAVCDEEAVIGSPFYVMEKVEGVVVTTELPEPLDNPTERERIADELVAALVELHGVDWRAIGLEGFGKPSGYLERQLRRFTGLWEHNRTRELPQVEEVGNWLAANLPQSPPATIVHGDYRLGNTMLAHDAPARLLAIFDWEMATIGDPLADIGYMMLHWVEPDDIVGRFTLQSVTNQPGFPTRKEMIARYEQRSGRSMQALDW
jgi:aminoglycoside phosphotransferase (APT) family kinase protein